MPGELRERIRATMDRQGWTQLVISRKLGVPQGAICKYLHGSEPRGRKYFELWQKLDDIDRGEEPGASGVLVPAGPAPVATAAAEEVPDRPTGMFAWLRGVR